MSNPDPTAQVIRWTLGQDVPRPPEGEYPIVVMQAHRLVRTGKRLPTPEQSAMLLAFAEALESGGVVPDASIDWAFDAMVLPKTTPFGSILRQDLELGVAGLVPRHPEAVRRGLRRMASRHAHVSSAKGCSLLSLGPVIAAFPEAEARAVCAELLENPSPILRRLAERMAGWLTMRELRGEEAGPKVRRMDPAEARSWLEALASRGFDGTALQPSLRTAPNREKAESLRTALNGDAGDLREFVRVLTSDIDPVGVSIPAAPGESHSSAVSVHRYSVLAVLEALVRAFGETAREAILDELSRMDRSSIGVRFLHSMLGSFRQGAPMK